MMSCPLAGHPVMFRKVIWRKADIDFKYRIALVGKQKIVIEVFCLDIYRNVQKRKARRFFGTVTNGPLGPQHMFAIFLTSLNIFVSMR